MNYIKEPLVSVVVITFNSSSYVIDTLESIRNQSYCNIELILSDDGSYDDSIDKCEKWILKNKNRFVKTFIVASENNTGISYNCNRGLNAANGDWLKIIAGDDMLMPNCIEDYVNFINHNNEAKFIFSKYRYLIRGRVSPIYYYRESFFKKTSEQQYNCLLREVGVNSSTSFINVNVLKDLGGFDNSFPFLEDAPLWLKASRNGYKLYSMDAFTVLYRIHENNSCLNNSDTFINLNYYNSKKEFYYRIIRDQLLRRRDYISLFSYFVEYSIKDYVIKRGNKKKNYNLFLRSLNIFNFKRLMGMNGFRNKHKDYNNLTLK